MMSCREDGHALPETFRASIPIGQTPSRFEAYCIEGFNQGQYAQAITAYFETQRRAVERSEQETLLTALNAGSRSLPEQMQVPDLIYYLQQVQTGTWGHRHKDPKTAASKIGPTCPEVKPLLADGRRVWVEFLFVVGAAGWGDGPAAQSCTTAGGDPSRTLPKNTFTGFSEASAWPQKNRHSRRQQRDEDDDDRPHHPRGKAQKGALDTICSLACPFYLRDKERHRNCLNYKLNRIVDVRLHIVRAHVQPSYCPQCGTEFQNDSDYAQRDTHIAHCQIVREIIRPSGATSEQLERMRVAAMHRGHGSTEESRWYAIWDIMFPGVARPPTPIIDVSWELNHVYLRAAIERYRQNGGVQDFARYVGVDASAANSSGVLSLFLDHLRDYNGSFMGIGHSYDTQDLRIDMTTDIEGSVQILSLAPVSGTGSNLDAQPAVPTIASLRLLAPRPIQADPTHVERILSNQDPNLDTTDDEIGYDYS
ncbi:hypothetical protein F5B22DRAFT_611736 [Xylaria bambusicola]|uniref:uncharacterized protein n=1 Tax=Xylaria bambusicola TaxID=326684 RepID=UPI002007F95C|nr:uncharacterized protein F5B22DRAFT_611736 [Xylaria bambusicola]KAI0513232.1 hypothetical protein F5B22DRAFT_611736 [Xylaria bambusicola]